MDALLQDLKYAVRRLVRAPGFTVVAILTLALGIGANAAIFSLVNAVLLKPLAGVAAPERLVTLFTSDFSSTQYGTSSYPDYEDVRRERVFADVAGLTRAPVNVVLGDQLERLNAELVTPNFFAVLGMRAAAGRLFTESDANAAVLVLSHAAWRTRYGGAANVIGSAVQVNNRAFTVIGVAAPAFHGATTGSRMEAWLPLAAAEHVTGVPTTDRGSRWLSVLARLAPGVTVAAAQSRMAVLQRSLFETYPEQWTNLRGESRTLTLLPEREARVPPDARGDVFTLAGVLLSAVAFVLLICCANVANLLLARGAARQREIVVRYSLGAQRLRVLRQLLTESLLLAVCGGVAGVLVSSWVTDLLLAREAGSALPFFLDASVDGRVLGFTLLVTLVTAALFGLIPALQGTRTPLGAVLKMERTLNAGGRARLRDALLGAQIALALLLSIGAGLLARTLQHARTVDVGLNVDGVVVARLDLQTQGYDGARSEQFQQELQRRLEALPDVDAVTYALRVPIANPTGRRTVTVADYSPEAGEEMEFPFNVVAADYFETMQLPLVEGRAFLESDAASGPGVIIVNETFAQRFWPGESALGRRVLLGRQALEVVGVARNGKYWALTEEPRPYYYLAASQFPAPVQLHVRARTDVAAVQRIVRQTVQQLDPTLPILSLEPMSTLVTSSLMAQRVAGGLVGVFALLAVLLAAVGVYGVTSVMVVQRVPEIGLRVALGARSIDVLRLVVGRAMIVAGAGIATGTALALLGTRAVESLLFGVSRFDPLSFALAAVVLAGAALLAAYLPARRASRVPPLIALTQ